MQQSIAMILYIITVLKSQLLLPIWSWFHNFHVFLDGVFGLIHPSDSYARLHFYKNRYPPSKKNESTCHLIVFQVVPAFFRFFCVATFSGGQNPGDVSQPPGTGWSIRGPTEVNQSPRLPTEVLPELTDLSEALMTEERGEEIKTQLKEMSLGFLTWWQLKYFLFSSRSLGKSSNFDYHCSKGLKPPTGFGFAPPKNSATKITNHRIYKELAYIYQKHAVFFGGNTV